MGTTWGAGTVYHSGTPEFTDGLLWVRVTKSLVFCVMFCRSLFVLFVFFSFGHRIACQNTVVCFDWRTVIYIYVCGKCRTQFMLPMEMSVTFTGVCANEIIPSINRSYVYKAKEGGYVRMSLRYIANSSWHWGSYGSIWTGPSPKKYYMHRNFWGPYTIFGVTDRSIYCHMTQSDMNYLLYYTFYLK